MHFQKVQAICERLTVMLGVDDLDREVGRRRTGGAVPGGSDTDAQIEYYASRDEAPGRWTGRAAEHLGLDGTVTHEQLRSLLNGRDPRVGADLMERRWARQSVVAYDVTFSAPKSVSLLWAVGDERTRVAVLRAHQAAVDAVCEYLQTHAGWGRRYDRESEETVPVRASLALPQFLHRTSRP